MLRAILAFGLLLIAGCAGSQKPPARQPEARTINMAMEEIGRKITPPKKTRVAVFPFPERGTGPTLLGEYVADKMMVVLGAQPTIELVERARIDAMRTEIGFSASGEVDDATAVSIGNMAGAETVLVGMLTKVGGGWELTSRLLGAEDGKVRAVAEARFDGSEVPGGLAGRPVAGTARPAGEPPAEETGQAAPKEGGIVFLEDFSEIDEGLLPEGWTADDGVGVRRSSRRAVLTSLKGGTHRIKTSPVRLPQDFEVEAVVKVMAGCFKLDIGGVSAQLAACQSAYLGGNAMLTNAKTLGGGMSSGRFREKLLLVNLKKKGPVFTLSVDGEKLLVSRISDYTAADRITMTLERFELRKLIVREVR